MQNRTPVTLRSHNQAHAAESRIRVRLVMHAGEILRDEYGVAGTAINVAFRLLEARALKQALAGSPGSVAPLAATAALVWNGDLPRPLQQILFDTADSATRPAPATLSRAG